METNKNVDVLLGNPKKAVLAMSIPFAIAMLVQNANSFIDGVWVAGLGKDALSAVGFIFPLFFLLVGIGNGIGVGASSAIGRRIGAKRKAEADALAAQSIALTIVASIVISIVLFFSAEFLLIKMGAGDALDLCMDYGMPIFLTAVILLLNGLFSNLLRTEGAAKRSMNTQILAAIINIILDPIFIYDFGFGMGIAGAAWATILSMTISLLIMMYWYFVKKDTFLNVSFKGFKFNAAYDREIFRVAIPVSLDFVVMSFCTALMNIIIVGVGGSDGVAIYSTAWRVIQMVMIPLFAISGAMVPICAAAYGAGKFDKIRELFIYSFKLCTIIMFVFMIICIIFAPALASLFTYSDNTADIKDALISSLRILLLKSVSDCG